MNLLSQKVRVGLCLALVSGSLHQLAWAESAEAGSSGQHSQDEKPVQRRRNWLVVSIQQDVKYVQSERGVCTPTKQLDGRWTCLRQASQTQYHGTPLPGEGGDVENSGFDLATTRLLIGYDRVLGKNFSIGVRGGYVLRGRGPRPNGAEAKDSLAWHGEGRFAYWFGSDPFARAGFRPFIFGFAGVAQIDTPFVVTVQEDRSVPPPPYQLRNPDSQQLDAWHRSGRGMVGLGGGLVYAITPAVGVLGELNWMQLFPTHGVALGMQLGVTFGF